MPPARLARPKPLSKQILQTQEKPANRRAFSISGGYGYDVERMRRLFPSLLLICLSGAGQDQRTSNLPPLPKIEVRRASARPIIDGKLGEADWKRADAVTFQFPWNEQTGAKQKTTARMLWDDEFLYISYECEDTDITAHYTKRDDPTYKDDAVEAFINPRPAQGDVYFGFEMNVRAVMYDYIYLQAKYLVKRLNLEGFQLATHSNGTLNASGDKDQGWSLEVAIPFIEFEPLSNATPKAGDNWTINLNRWDGVEPNRRLSLWSDSAMVKPNPHNIRRFGTMVFVQ